MKTKAISQSISRGSFLLALLIPMFVLGMTFAQSDGLSDNLPEGSVNYYKLSNLATLTSYNITLTPVGAIDFTFTIYSDRFCTSVIRVVDDTGVSASESVYFTPTSSGDFYLSVSSNFGWGDFSLTAREGDSGPSVTIVEHQIPNRNWIWIVIIAIGILVVLIISYFVIARIIRSRDDKPKKDRTTGQRKAALSAKKALAAGDKAYIEGYFEEAIRHFKEALRLDRRLKKASAGIQAAQKAQANLGKKGRLRLILTSGDKERFVQNFERSSGLTAKQLETYAMKILVALKEEERMPDSQKMFLKMRIPVELQDDVRAYLLSRPETDIDQLSPEISRMVDDISAKIFGAYGGTEHLELDFGDIVLQMNESIVDAKVTVAAIESAIKKPYTRIPSLEVFSKRELRELDELTPKLFTLIKEKGVVTAFDVMSKLQIGCVTAHKLLSLINFLEAQKEITVDESYIKKATTKLMEHLVKHDNGEMPQTFSVEELISKGLTALEAEAFISEYERILNKVYKRKPTEKESIKLQEDFFELMEACKAEGLSASIASNIVLRGKALEAAIRTDVHIRNAVLPNLESFTDGEVDLPTISLGAEKIQPRVFTKEEEQPVITAETPIGTRCMVSGLVIDFEKDRVVACPFCGNIAKYEMLAEWLKVKSVCPICKNNLRIEECQEISLDEVYS